MHFKLHTLTIILAVVIELVAATHILGSFSSGTEPFARMPGQIPQALGWSALPIRMLSCSTCTMVLMSSPVKPTHAYSLVTLLIFHMMRLLQELNTIRLHSCCHI